MLFADFSYMYKMTFTRTHGPGLACLPLNKRTEEDSRIRYAVKPEKIDHNLVGPPPPLSLKEYLVPTEVACLTANLFNWRDD